MDSSASGFFLNPSTFHTVYNHAPKQDDDGIIDLGLSLRTFQPEPSSYHPPSHMVSLDLEGYHKLIEEWPETSKLRLKNPMKGCHGLLISGDGEEEVEGVQSKETWAYIKVNMDGVMVGRKICILDHSDYLSLARKMEHMFGKQTESGLGLFLEGTEYSLFYKDRENNWRPVGDVPWKEFAECVRRLRIARN